jgi:uncharacterized protein
VFFESKFWSLFSLLFGISFWLQTRIALQPWRLLRRYGALLLFGCCHALFFEGDILMLYAEFGVLLLLLHGCSTRVLVVIATALLLIFPLAHYLAPDRGFSDSPSTVTEARQWLEEDREDGLYSTGSLDEIFAEHASYLPEIPWQDYQWPDSGWAVFALFLLGFCFAREGGLQWFIQRPERVFSTGRWMFLLGLSAMTIEGWMTYALSYRVFGDTASSGVTQLIGDLAFLFGTLLLTAAWFCLMHSFATRLSRLVGSTRSGGSWANEPDDVSCPNADLHNPFLRLWLGLGLLAGTNSRHRPRRRHFHVPNSVCAVLVFTFCNWPL